MMIFLVEVLKQRVSHIILKPPISLKCILLATSILVTDVGDEMC